MDNRYLQILEYLEPNGLGIYINISPILDKMFPVTDTHDYPSIRAMSGKVQDFLHVITNDGIIKLKDRSTRSLGSGNTSGGFAWFHNTPIEASIASPGLEDLSLYRAKSTNDEMRKSVLTANASVERLNGITEKNYVSQRNLTIVALMIAGVGTLSSITSIFKSNQKMPNRFEVNTPKTDSILQMIWKTIDTLSKNQQCLDSNLKNGKSSISNTSFRAISEIK